MSKKNEIDSLLNSLESENKRITKKEEIKDVPIKKKEKMNEFVLKKEDLKEDVDKCSSCEYKIFYEKYNNKTEEDKGKKDRRRDVQIFL